MTSVLYSTIGSLCQGVFDMQAIKNDTLKPAPQFKTFEMLDVEVPRALIDYMEGAHMHPEAQHEIRAYEDYTRPRVDTVPDTVQDILSGMKPRFGVRTGIPFIDPKMDVDALEGYVRHLVPMSYDVEAERWEKAPSCVFSKRDKPKTNRKFLVRAKEWNKRLSHYDVSKLRLTDGTSEELQAQLCAEMKSYQEHVGHCTSDPDKTEFPSKNLYDEWTYGFLMGEKYVAVDCDCKNDQMSALLLKYFLSEFPGSPIRSRGGSHWASILYIEDGDDEDRYKGWNVNLDIHATTIWTGGTSELLYNSHGEVAETSTCRRETLRWGQNPNNGDCAGQLELFGYGRQLVVQGWHSSDAPYTWYGGNVTSIVRTTRKRFKAFRAKVAKHFSYSSSRDLKDVHSDAPLPPPTWDGKSISPFVGKGGRFFEYLNSLHSAGLFDAIRASSAYIDEDDEKIYLHCPNEANHSKDTGKKQCCVFKDTRVFKCFHASCENKTQEYFKSHFPHQSEENVITRLNENGCFSFSETKDGVKYLSEILCKTPTYKTILEDPAYCGIEFSHDDFTNKDLYRIVQRRFPKQMEGIPDTGEIGECKSFVTELQTLMSHIGLKKCLSDQTVVGLLKALCYKNRFDSLYKWVNDLPEWDGHPRVENFFDLYLTGKRSDEQREWMRRCSSYLFTAMISRMLCVEGSQVDISLVLQGSQGQRKSTLTRILAGTDARYQELNFGASYKDRAQDLEGKTVVEVGEMAGMRKRDVEEIKSFLTAREDKFRAPYEAEPSTHVRRCVFILTTNDSEVLRDPTGNRRFAVVNVGWGDGQFLYEKIREEYHQIMAEARVMYDKNGVMWQPVAEMQESANAPAVVEDAWTEILRGRIDGLQWISNKGVYRLAQTELLLTVDRLDSGIGRRLVSILNQLGMRKRRVKSKGREHSVYAREGVDNEVIRDGLERGQDSGDFNGRLVPSDPIGQLGKVNTPESAEEYAFPDDF